MKVAGIQWNVRLGDCEYNYAMAEKYIIKAAKQGNEVLVLPELWNTGFFPKNIYDIADEKGNYTQAFLQRLATRLGVHIISGSVAVREQKRLYNRLYTVTRTGEIVCTYDKVHLFTRGHEDEYFSAGFRCGRWRLDGISMGAILCYDLRFGGWIQKVMNEPCDVLFVSAAWPTKRGMHWDLLNRVRAIEHQCYVVAVNTCGSILYGHSQVIDPWGNILVQAGIEDEIIEGEIKPETVVEIRNKIPVQADIRRDLY